MLRFVIRAATLVVVVALFAVMPAVAQPPSPQASASPGGAERGGGEWIEYQNIQDGFKVVFPSQPKVTETTWTSEYGYIKLPARVCSAERGARALFGHAQP